MSPHEAAYRRGYTHGYSNALDHALEMKCNQNSKWWQSLAKFFDKEVMGWRYDTKKFIPPGFKEIE
jgi:hypothetical protein